MHNSKDVLILIVGQPWEGGRCSRACTALSAGEKGLRLPFWRLIQGQAQASKLTLTSQRSSANPAKAKIPGGISLLLWSFGKLIIPINI